MKIILIGIILSLMVSCVYADFAQGIVEFTKPYIGIGIAAAYFSDKDPKNGINNAARVLDANLLAIGTARLMKYETVSFPSGHAAGAFATASSLSKLYPKQKWLWYGSACLIGWSLVETNNHSWGEVAGGAALGISAGNWSVSSDKGLMLGRVFRF